VSTASCLYEGTVHHRRAHPRREFRHRLALAYLDLDELPGLLGGRLLRRRPGLVRFRRGDYLGDATLPLHRSVGDLVQERTGVRPSGPVRMLANLRTFGHCFNPVSFYYCLDGEAEHVESLVAEVTNTPWGERHAYVIPGGAGEYDKRLHVSPFMEMDHVYSCRASVPGRTLSVHIENRWHGRTVFDATLSLRRRELTDGALRATALRFPPPTVRVLALIYGHALGLRLAGAPVFAHPEGAGR
jgi:DUF1365 family protein